MSGVNEDQSAYLSHFNGGELNIESCGSSLAHMCGPDDSSLVMECSR